VLQKNREEIILGERQKDKEEKKKYVV